MKSNRIATILICVTSAAARALAQVPYANFTLSWSEVNAAGHSPVTNPNGILEPGEAARISFAVEFNPVGTVFPNGSGTLTVAGFARTGFGLGAGVAGTWSDQQIASGFLGDPLLPLGPHTITQSVWQPTPPLGSVPLATNPIPSLWSVVWLPPSYLPQAASFGLFEVSDDSPRLFAQTGTDPQGNPLFTMIDTESSWGATIGIPMAPAPSIPSAVLLTSAFAARRRRPRRHLC